MRNKDPIYEELLAYLSTPKTVAQMLQFFEADSIDRNEINYRLRKGFSNGDILKMSPGTQYRTARPRHPAENPKDVLHSLMFHTWADYEARTAEPTEETFLLIITKALRLYNKKYSRNYQLQEFEIEDES